MFSQVPLQTCLVREAARYLVIPARTGSIQVCTELEVCKGGT